MLIASEQGLNYTATVTTNANMVQIGRQFVWMELFAHRVFSQLDLNAVPHLGGRPQRARISDRASSGRVKMAGLPLSKAAKTERSR